MSRSGFRTPLRATVYLSIISTVVSSSFLDPINWPKQVALISLIPLILFYAFRSSGFSTKQFFHNRISVIVGISVSLWVISALVNWSSSMRSLFGVWGRNNGLLSLVGFALIALAVSISVRSLLDIESFLLGVTYFAIFSGLYALLQILDSDPIAWSKQDEVFAFFGNTNFASAVFGLGASCAISLGYLKRRDIKASFVFLLLFCFLTYVTFSTESLQGLVVIGIVASLIVYLLISSKSRLLSGMYIVLLLIGGTFGVLGTAGFGPLGNFLYQYTINLRTWYWRVGIDIGSSNPIFGVGVDSYGDFYREFRPIELIRLTSMDLTVNNAHNTFIQIYATLGILGLIGILLPFTIAIPIAVKELFNPSRNEKSVAVILFLSIWLAAVISIDNIAIAVWNWAFLGLILSFTFSRESNSESSATYEGARKKRKKSNLYDWNLVSMRIVSLIVFLLVWQISSPDRQLLNEKRYILSAESTPESKARKIESLLSISSSPFLMEKHVAELAIEHNSIGGWSKGREIVKEKLNTYPSDFYLWDQLAVFEENGGSLKEALEARQKQLTLDPHHASVWLIYANDLFLEKRFKDAKKALGKANSLKEFLTSEGIQRMFQLEQQIKDSTAISN